MDRLSIDEKFKIAVNIIQRMPKEGSFSPSNDLKLKFYSYFKQATEGPCTQPKPPFWDLVKKAKWDAWMKLGSLPSDDAKKCYVQEIIGIMKEVDFAERSENEDDLKEVVKVLGPFVEVILPKYPFLSKVMANGQACGDLTDNNNDRDLEDLNSKAKEEQKVNEDERTENGYTLEEDFFSDTSDQIVFMECSSVEPSQEDKLPAASQHHKVVSTGESCGAEVDEHLAIAVIRLQNTLVEVQNRLDAIENLLKKKKASSSRLPVLELSTPALVLILSWPFLIHLLLHTLLARPPRRN